MSAPTSKAPLSSGAERRFLPFLAAVVLLGAVARVAFPEATARLDSTTLLYAVAAASLLLAREIKSLAFGDYKVEFERATRIAQEALDTAQDAQATAIGSGKGGVKRGGSQGVKGAASAAPQPGNAPDDPWKGVFGERAQTADRRLSAKVTGSDGWYKVELRVESMKPKSHPLTGSVQYFLHNSFLNDRPLVTVNQDGVAPLTLYAYGAFTVGVLADGGTTRLELDLAELADAPKEFREN